MTRQSICISLGHQMGNTLPSRHPITTMPASRLWNYVVGSALEPEFSIWITEIGGNATAQVTTTAMVA